jgi:hypothetical protein
VVGVMTALVVGGRRPRPLNQLAREHPHGPG